MTVAFRPGSTMLARFAARPAWSPLQTLAVSSQQAAYFHASRVNGAPRPETRRRNPLVGSMTPAQQPQEDAKAPSTPVEAEAPSSSNSEPSNQTTNSAASSFATSDIFRPRPPRPPRYSPNSNNTRSPSSPTSPSKGQFAYDATSTTPSNRSPFEVDIASIIANKAAAFGREANIGDPQKQPQVYNKPATGRTVFVRSPPSPNSAPTPTLALRTLNRVINQQKVRTKFYMQKFHERKGLKRKRLRSERWRARFKVGFRAACDRVLDLKRQGW